jgi:hypothetical protein
MSKKAPISVAEADIPLQERRLAHAEALASPCASCDSAPCCTHLPLHSFKITNMVELDHAVYLLNFDRIQLGLSASGEWSVYYVYPCRFLNRQDFSCTVHHTATQPHICVNYNPYNCWYKRVFTGNVSQEFLQIDYRRMQFILARIVFDDARNIVEVPDWSSLMDELAKLPLEPDGIVADTLLQDPILETWQQLVVHGPGSNNGRPPAGQSYTYNDLHDPCQGCSAQCCQTLVFPQTAPATMGNLDFYRFCLGFPGVELGITDDGWSIVVKSRCRHLQGNRCALYGQPERPLICKYYDAWKCTYKTNFGVPRPDGFLRLRLEQFNQLVENFRFDEQGAVVEFPTLELIRSTVENGWREVTEPVTAEPLPLSPSLITAAGEVTG